MNGSALTLLPARARQVVYVIYGLVALAVAATAVGYNSLDLPNPPWLVVAGAVVSFLAVPFSALASLNVSATQQETRREPEPWPEIISNTPLADRDKNGDGRDDQTGRFLPKN